MLHEPLFAWWCDTGIGKFLGSVKPTLFNDCMALAIGVFGGLAALIIPKQLSNEGNRFASVVAGYMLFIILVQSISFNDCFIHSYSAPWFRYTDLLVPFLLVFWVVSWIKSKDEKLPQNSNADNESHLLYDDTDEADFLNRGERLKHICEFLRENKGNGKCATGVAITGGWGAGKSWVLEHVKKHMEQEGEICIDFKPWVYGETDITRQFYLTLERELKSQNYKVKELKDAVLEMDNDKLSGMGRATVSLLGGCNQVSGTLQRH